MPLTETRSHCVLQTCDISTQRHINMLCGQITNRKKYDGGIFQVVIFKIWKLSECPEKKQNVNFSSKK